ncbi:MAG: signal recognition particle protein, partial [Thermomicrobiales bacterium]
MGDIVSLVERAQEQTDEKEATRLQDRMFKGQLDLEDFLEQMQKIKKMGPLNQILEMIPGIGSQLRQAKAEISDKDMSRVEAIIRSMTPQERRRPEMIDRSRKRR